VGRISHVRAVIVTPAPPRSTNGNRITALRWAKRLRELGWQVRVVVEWRGEACDLLVALHAKKSHASVVAHARMHADAPRVVALTGTDLYGDVNDPQIRESLALASRLVVLQQRGLAQLAEADRGRARVIVQSAVAPARAIAQPPFTACVLAHMRDVKDPLLAARAIESLPASSPVRVIHLGGADASWRERARAAEQRTGGRWRWLGPLPRTEALRVLAGSQLLAVTSVAEGGANVVTEAIAAGIPVVSTRIAGSLGILGDEYPGYFDVGDAAGMAALLAQCDQGLARELEQRVVRLQSLVTPSREREAWRALISEL
jgi:putative glycosyltransferase (TIGR04348 family)